jgi:putative flippase GtrA
MAIDRSFVRFAIVGVVGFLVDAAVAYLCIYGLGMSPLLARGPSFFCAVTTTWALNRVWSFRSAGGGPLGEWAKYVAANSIGLGVNALTYAVTLALVPPGPLTPLLGIALGSVAGLIFNYTASRRFVFKGSR